MYELSRLGLILLAFCANGSLAPWVLGTHPVGTFAPVQLATLPGAVGSIGGLFLRTDRAHTILVVIALLILLGALAFTPVLPHARSAA